MMRAIILQANPMRPIFHWLILVLFATALSGCVYRMTIQQGNSLEAKTVDQLQAGMTRTQVRYLLGTPMVPDAFDNDRWDYLYYLKKGRLKAPEQRHLVVHFDGDKVSKFERDAIPAAAPTTAEVKPSPDLPKEIVSPSDPTATKPDASSSTQPGEPTTPSPIPPPSTP